MAATPAPAPDPEAGLEPEPVASSAAASAPEQVFASAAPATAKPVPVPSHAPRRSGLIQRLAFRDRIRRWWRGPDRPPARVGGAVVLTALLSLEALHLGRVYAVQYPEIHPAYWWIVFILAVAGLLIAAFERPPRWPTTVPHLLNSVYFVVLPLVLIRLKTVYYDPGNGPSALLEGTLLGGTIAYAIAALGCGIAVLRRARDALTVTGLVTTVLMTAGAALIAISEFRSPSFLSVPGCGILLAAAVSSLVMAAILLRRLLRPRVSAGR